MSHDGFKGRCSTIEFSPCGENVAWNQGYGMGTGSGNSPMKAFTGWKESPGHYANMVNTAFDTVGYGYHECNDGKIYWTGLYGSPK